MSKQRKLLTYELVRELFNYRDGGLYWKAKRNGRGRPGDRFGAVGNCEYRCGCINKVMCYEHRLIFIWHYGFNTENQIDHIDRDKLNNRIENLREASDSCNAINRGIQSNNNSGVTGVYRRKNSWQSRIKVNGRNITTGQSRDKDTAIIMRWKAEVDYGFHNCYSTSSSYLYLKEKGLIDSDNIIYNTDV